MTEPEIVTAARQIRNRAARQEFLVEHCAGHDSLLHRVAQQLDTHLEPTEILGKPVGSDGPAAGAVPGPNKHPGPLLSFLTPSEKPGGMGRLKHYEILEILGRGGFGIVAKAFDEKLQRLVAIKILLPELAVTSPPRKRFLREARSAAKVRHENVVQIYDVEEDPVPFLVMEYIDGQTLQQKLDEQGPLAPAEIVRWGREIALGLAAAHNQALIHRDIKPANILLDGRAVPRVKISDFGLARTADDASLTQSGLISGTPMFMAPEQARGEELDGRADLFSLGSVLYTMCTGRAPFRAANTYAVLKRVNDETPRPIRELIPEIPTRLCEIVTKLHEKNRELRYRSALEVAQDLAECPLTPSQRLPSPSAKPRPALRPGAKPMFARVAALLAFVGLIALGSTLWDRFGGSPKAVSSQATQPTIPSLPSSITPATQLQVPRSPELNSWEKSVAAMPALDRIETVLDRLHRLNPTFNKSSATYEIKDNRIVSLQFETHQVTDISPLRALGELEKLILEGGGPGGKLTEVRALKGLRLKSLHLNHNPIRDLEPLREMPLEYLTIWQWAGTDLSPLKGMSTLRHLNCGSSTLVDLSPLKGLPLEYLCINMTHVSDLSPLAEMPLRELLIQQTRVSDLSPLKDTPLEILYMLNSRVKDTTPIQHKKLKEIKLDYSPERDRKWLQSLPTLETINEKPAAEFLAEQYKPRLSSHPVGLRFPHERLQLSDELAVGNSVDSAGKVDGNKAREK